MRTSAIIVLSLLPAYVIGDDNECRTTSKDNCYDNVGQPCGNSVSGDPIKDGADICCYGGSESGVVRCDASGVFVAVACASGLTCKTDFSRCLHRCS